VRGSVLTTVATSWAVHREPIAAPAASAGVFGTLAVPAYPAFWLARWLWNSSRWMGLFAASYVVFHRGGATLEVQLVGTSFFAPMFIGGLAGGVIADRFDRRRVLVLQLWLLAGVSLLYHIAMSILHSRRVQHRGMR
jgi:MFS family permease